MSSDVGLDETDDRILVKMLWETRVYVMQNFKEFTELAKVLTSWSPLSMYTAKAVEAEGSSKGESAGFWPARLPCNMIYSRFSKLSRYFMLLSNMSDVILLTSFRP